jgi:hypothetical protein
MYRAVRELTRTPGSLFAVAQILGVSHGTRTTEAPSPTTPEALVAGIAGAISADTA